jgi:hypothetical protein
MTDHYRDWVSIGKAGEDVMKSMERNWPACDAVVVRIAPNWTCTCGRVLKNWDVVLDATESADTPLRIICSACHTALLSMERAE